MKHFATILLLASAIHAQDLTHKAAPQKERIAIVNARMLGAEGSWYVVLEADSDQYGPRPAAEVEEKGADEACCEPGCCA